MVQLRPERLHAGVKRRQRARGPPGRAALPRSLLLPRARHSAITIPGGTSARHWPSKRLRPGRPRCTPAEPPPATPTKHVCPTAGRKRRRVKRCQRACGLAGRAALRCVCITGFTVMRIQAMCACMLTNDVNPALPSCMAHSAQGASARHKATFLLCACPAAVEACAAASRQLGVRKQKQLGFAVAAGKQSAYLQLQGACIGSGGYPAARHSCHCGPRLRQSGVGGSGRLTRRRHGRRNAARQVGRRAPSCERLQQSSAVRLRCLYLPLAARFCECSPPRVTDRSLHWP